jgi:hypothetical protein
MSDSRLLVRPRFIFLASLVLASGLGVATASEPAKPAARPAAKAQKVQKPPEPLIQANSPPFSDPTIFPCSSCHDGTTKVDVNRHEVPFHNGPGEPVDVLDHGAERWCLDCHDAKNRDVLRSASGQPIPFTESYRLCGQCHGDKYRDWKVGVHGKRIGLWNGAKTYFLCVNCHNPHTPRWKGINDRMVDGRRVVSPTLEKLTPEPMPFRPEQQRLTAEEITKGREAARAKAHAAEPAKQEVHP